MSGVAGTSVAVIAGLGAAGSFGAGVTLQHRQARTGPGRRAGTAAADRQPGPPAGRSDAPAGHWLAAFAVVALVAAAALAAGLAIRGAARPVLLAAAAGTVFGLTAAVTLSPTRLLPDHGPGYVLGH